MSTKVWLVTGTGSGLGRRLVHQILARKDKVIAAARNVEEISEFATNEDVHRLQLDITESKEYVQGKIAEAVGIWGRIDNLVNNAGAGHKSLMEEGGVEGLERQFKVNVFGPMNVTYAVLPYMRKARSGTIVFVGSRSAIRNEFPGIGIYASSKAALHSLGETLAAEVRPFGIKVMVLQPGSFRTEGMMRYPFLAEGAPGAIPEYEETRRNAGVLFDSVIGNETGDPVKGMSLLVDVVRGEGAFKGRELPLWLALGSDSEGDYRERVRRILESLDENSDISRASDFEKN